MLPEENGQPGPYVVEKHCVSFVVSGRDLVQKAEQASGNPGLIIAAADFDHATQKSAESRRPPVPAWISRGAETPATAGVPANWPPLLGTAAEAEWVGPALAAYTKHKPAVLLGSQASEAALKDTWRPRIVLLSTHGFFLEPASQADAAAQPNPLLRCGLVLAGANDRTGAQLDVDDDGILTGLDVLSTDLRGTELVVLSACETGLGQVHAGEGVAGLRQAFQLTGARAVVATLWRIPDDETAWLMSQFFEQLAAGSDKATALAQAQRGLIAARRQADKSPHPYLWAAFSLTGDGRVPDVGPAATRPPRPAAQPEVEVVVEYARIMDKSALVAQALRGERLVRGKTQGNWIQVYFEPGSQRSGWIQQSDVRPVR